MENSVVLTLSSQNAETAVHYGNSLVLSYGFPSCLCRNRHYQAQLLDVTRGGNPGKVLVEASFLADHSSGGSKGRNVLGLAPAHVNPPVPFATSTLPDRFHLTIYNAIGQAGHLRGEMLIRIHITPLC